ncbi:MAG: DUF4252 domain-containing protein [Flavobacteriaceae bacterium]|nr:DUF4252 domain-containing protein [Flavobacteriaceae bacterium]
MKTIKNILSVIVVSLVFVSCNTTPTIQEYIVKHQEDNRFTYADVSSNLLQLKEISNATENSPLGELLNSIHKVNFLSLKDNEDLYQTESKKITEIIKKSEYKTLSKVSSKNFNMSASYLGDDDNINEMLVFIKVKQEKSFMLVRILGNKINVSKVSELLNSNKVDKNSEDALKDILNNIGF